MKQYVHGKTADGEKKGKPYAISATFNDTSFSSKMKPESIQLHDCSKGKWNILNVLERSCAYLGTLNDWYPVQVVNRNNATGFGANSKDRTNWSETILYTN
ncbi:hypothetical protein RUM43_000416, partial [Polyplax serrata]